MPAMLAQRPNMLLCRETHRKIVSREENIEVKEILCALCGIHLPRSCYPAFFGVSCFNL